MPCVRRRLAVDPALGVLRGAGVGRVKATGAACGAAWGLAIANTMLPELVADLPAVRALLARALELDEDYNRGAVHGALIILESLPAEVGGSSQRAKEHFDRAVELSDGLDASPYVSYATGVLQPSEERAEWERLLRLALAVDPDEDTSHRLLNLINQRRAQSLLDHADELFFDPANTEEVRP